MYTSLLFFSDRCVVVFSCVHQLACHIRHPAGVDNGPDPSPSHRSDSTVQAVDVRRTDAGLCIASADAHGVVCTWALDFTISSDSVGAVGASTSRSSCGRIVKCTFSGRPCVRSKALGAVHGVWLSPSCSHVYIATEHRVLLGRNHRYVLYIM